MASGYNLRVGDADREAIAAQLREHFADGRLTLEELNERLDQTFAAKTRADLTAVMRDLPHVARPFSGAGAEFSGSGWQGSRDPAGQPGWGYGGDSGRRHGPSAFAPTMALVWLLLIASAVMLFGIGGGSPLVVVLILAAIGFLKRLFGLGGGRGRGPRGRGRGSRGPRF
jgi:hypothetical protein